MLRSLRHHEAAVVEALPSRAPGDLVEVARGEHRGLLPVELAEPGEEHRADGHVDAHPQGVGAADDLEQAGLGELLDEHPVFGQQAGVVQANALLEPLADVGTVGASEAEPGDRGSHRVLLFAGTEVEAREILRALRRVFLREVHHVDRRLVLRGELVQGLGQRDLGVGVLEGHRPLDRLDDGRGSAVAPGEVLREEGHVAQGGRHEKETRPGKGEQRHLPGHPPVAVGVPVELVHHHVVDRRVLPVAQSDVGEHLCGAAQDGRVAVDGGVAGGETHVLGAELTAQGHPLLVDQRLDGAGVDRTPSVRERSEVQGGGHERLPRAGGGVQDDVLPLEQLEDRLLLRGVEGEPLARDVVEEAAEQLVALGLAWRQDVVERTGHPGGIWSLLAPSHCANVWSLGLRARDNARSRAPQNSASKSRLNWNMLARSSAPGNPKVR